MNPAAAITIREVKGKRKPWGAFYRVTPTATNTSGKKVEFFATQAEAEAFKAQAVDLLRRQPVATPGPTPVYKPDTVAGYLTTWLAVTVNGALDSGTYQAYEKNVRLKIIPTKVTGPSGADVPFGDLKIARLRPLMIRDLMKRLHGAGVSLSRRRMVLSTLSSACSAAVVDEVMEINPCPGVGRRLRQKNETQLGPQPNPFTRAEIATFFAYVETHEPKWLEYFRFLYKTGVRVGEIGALKWPTVDLAMARAEIVGSFSPIDKADKDPKTHRNRWIDLADDVVADLEALGKRQRVDMLRFGWPKTGYVFLTRNGTQVRQNATLRAVWPRIMTATGLDHTPHDLRDSFATHHINANYEKLGWVSHQLGHRNPQTTINHYYRFLPSEFREKKYANDIR